MIKKYLFFYWDGVAFFALNEAKLSRLRGKPPSYWDKCSSVRKLIELAIYAVIIGFVIWSQLEKVVNKTLKSQTVELNPASNFTFDALPNTPFIAIVPMNV
jgi:hypothetical protein